MSTPQNDEEFITRVQEIIRREFEARVRHLEMLMANGFQPSDSEVARILGVPLEFVQNGLARHGVQWVNPPRPGTRH